MGAILYKMVRDGLSNEMTLSRDLKEVRDQALKIPGTRVQADGRASAKALRWESAWHIQKGACKARM